MSDLDTQQQSAITQLYEQNTLLIAQAGFGKTVVAQTAIQELIQDGYLSRVLIVAPLKVCTLTWAHEWEEWCHLIEPALAIGTAKERRAAIEGDEPIVVINFENLVWFFDTYGNDHGFDGLLIDEGSKLKAVGTANMKKLHGRRGRLKPFEWRSVMSATPVHESGTDVYSQMMIVDGGAALGTNQDNFRREYFMQMDFKGYRWKFQPGGLERLTERIDGSVFVADTADYEAQLPEPIEETVLVKMPRAGWDAYDAMCTRLITEVDGEEIEAANLAVSVGKLQQICCGAMYKNKERDVAWLHSAKLEAAVDLIELELAGKPVVIVYQFLYELDALKQHFGSRAMVLGDAPAEAKAAWNAGELEYLLVHPKSAGHGLNLQGGGHEMVCLGPLWSADNWDQLMRRLWRRGQQSPFVRRWTLCVEHSIEEDMLERLAGKMRSAEAFIDHLRERTG